MKILVERLTTSPTEHRFGPDDPGWLEVQEVVPELAGALAEVPSATVRVQRMGLDVFLEGALEGALELACSRCLARYRQPLREPFRLVLEPAGARVPSEPEAARDLSRLGMCLGDELEMGWFHGPEIDLRALLREVVALALPVQPLCRESCRGLCPACGVDRNVEPCDCRTGAGAAARGEDVGAPAGASQDGERQRGAQREGGPRRDSPFAVLEALRRRGREGDS